MCLQNEKPDNHWRKTFRKQRVVAAEHLGERDLIVITLSHFFPVDGYHIIVHPVFSRRGMIANSALCYFTFMVRKHKVHSSSMNIKARPEVFCSHCRAFNMPSWKTFAPWAFPTHDVLRRS